MRVDSHINYPLAARRFWCLTALLLRLCSKLSSLFTFIMELVFILRF